jgi:hypothetical protein
MTKAKFAEGQGAIATTHESPVRRRMRTTWKTLQTLQPARAKKAQNIIIRKTGRNSITRKCIYFNRLQEVRLE